LRAAAAAEEAAAPFVPQERVGGRRTRAQACYPLVRRAEDDKDKEISPNAMGGKGARARRVEMEAPHKGGCGQEPGGGGDSEARSSPWRRSALMSPRARSPPARLGTRLRDKPPHAIPAFPSPAERNTSVARPRASEGIESVSSDTPAFPRTPNGAAQGRGRRRRRGRRVVLPGELSSKPASHLRSRARERRAP